MIKKSIIFAAAFSFLWSTVLCATEANTVSATINVGVTPAGIAVTPNNLFAYVANNNNYSIPGANTVSVLNLTNNTVETTIFDISFNEPYTVTINASGTKAYVTNSNSTTVTIIDIATNTVIGTIGGFDGPSGLVISHDGNFAYVNNYGGPGGVGSGNGTTVRVVNLLSNTIVGPPITVGLAPASLAITPDGAFVYVINYVDGNPGTGTISVIQTSNNTVVDTIGGFSGPFAIAITPNGRYAYVTNFGSNNFSPVGNTVSVVDLQSNTVIATITVGTQPSGIAITPDGSLAYVSIYNTLYVGPDFNGLTAGPGTVKIIDTQTNQVIPPTIAVGLSPDAIAISPNGAFAYVTNYTSNTVSVIPLQTFRIVAQGCKTKTKFATQIDLINELTWTVSGVSLPVIYSIYRDNALTDLAGTVRASQPLAFLDHNRHPNVIYTYYIVGTNASGITSNPVEITVSQKCTH
ncbi:MAG TPA: YncE family protein [Rhabdochlamydiaceae bacterium]|nr:YncE family protein [Rhabdochlamydiaceae bacterium]